MTKLQQDTFGLTDIREAELIETIFEEHLVEGVEVLDRVSIIEAGHGRQFDTCNVNCWGGFCNASVLLVYDGDEGGEPGLFPSEPYIVGD